MGAAAQRHRSRPISQWLRIVLWCLAAQLLTALAAVAAPAQAAGPSADRTPAAADLPSIEARGVLRILYSPRDYAHGESRGAEVGRTLLGAFAAERGLETRWIPIADPDELVAHLLSGHGDVINGELPLQFQNHPGIRGSLTLGTARYVAVARAGEDIGSPADLVHRQVAVSRASPIWEVMARLAGPSSQIGLVTVPGYVDNTITLDQVAVGVFDATVAPMSVASRAVAKDARLHIAFDMVPGHPIAWQTRSGDVQLRGALNEFLLRSGLTHYDRPAYAADLPSLKDRQRLRIITIRDRDSVFIKRGRPAGFEYDVTASFARAQHLRPELLIAESEAEALRWLKRGYGDLIAARVSEEAVADPQISASRRFNFIAPTLVASASSSPVDSLEQLAGKTIAVRSNSIHQSVLRELQAAGIRLQAVPENASVDDLLESVNAGRTPYAVVDAHRLLDLSTRYPRVRPSLTLSSHFAARWLVRSDNYELLGASNAFLEGAYRSKFYNLAYQRYFERRSGAGLTAGGPTQLSPYDALARKYAARYDFDWRLLVALMRTESRFDPQAVSDAGARGLMQLLPKTAHELGFDDVMDPEHAVNAGAAYLDALRRRFEDELPIAQRTWFALAAYNTGYERVQAARRLARQVGLDPNRWFDNVEMLMLASSRKADDPSADVWSARCRCGATVAYVREIRSLYDAYIQLLEPVRLAALSRESDFGT